MKIFRRKQPRDHYQRYAPVRSFSWKRFAVKYFILTAIVAGSTWYGYSQVDAMFETKIVEKEVEVVGFPPILRKIAKAESLDSHFCTKEHVKAKLCAPGAVGTVLVNTTLDVGRYQINLPANGKWCVDRGYDPFIEKDNEECAKELFAERGSEPWSASKKHWSK